MTDYGLVSIIMPNYNGGKFLKDTIDSVLAQTYDKWELLFVDDCSTDDSLEVVSSFNDDRIIVMKNQKNSGAAFTRNCAIEAAGGRWLAFLDSDDLWTPDKLEKQLKFMTDNELSLTFTDYEVIGDNDEKITVFRPRLDFCTYKDLLKHNYMGCLTVICDTEKIGKVYMPVEAIKREDMACWLRVLKKGTTAYCLHECLSSYRVHSNSVSSNKIKMMKYQWDLYRKVEKISFFGSVYYMIYWAVLGFIKYK